MLTTKYLYNNTEYSSKLEILSVSDSEFINLTPQFKSTLATDCWIPMPLKESIRKRLLKISNGGPISIAYSGGIDSEILLYCALEAGIDATAVTTDLFGINIYDVMRAKTFCTNHNVNHEIIEVTEHTVRSYFLPKMCLEIETPAYLLLGGYIAADTYANKSGGAPLIIANLDPCQFIFDEGFTYFSEAEYGMWVDKFNNNRKKTVLYDVMTDPSVFFNFVNSPLISERILGCPYSKYFFDARYLGKEYYYQDPDFSKLTRRFSQHGWETIKKSHGYTKEMVPDCNPDLKSEGAPFICTNAATMFINSQIRENDPDLELFTWMQSIPKKETHRYAYKKINTQVFIPTPPIGEPSSFTRKTIAHDYSGHILSASAS